MDLRPLDRRGLGEIVTWACVTTILGVLNLAYMILTSRRASGVEVDHTLMGALVGAITAFIARGTQGAAERSGASEAMNAAIADMRVATRELTGSHRLHKEDDK